MTPLKRIFEEKKEDLNLTQKSIAEELGISPAAVSKYMTGMHISITTAKKFAKILECDLTDIRPDLVEPEPVTAAVDAKAAVTILREIFETAKYIPPLQEEMCQVKCFEFVYNAIVLNSEYDKNINRAITIFIGQLNNF